MFVGTVLVLNPEDDVSDADEAVMAPAEELDGKTPVLRYGVYGVY